MVIDLSHRVFMKDADFSPFIKPSIRPCVSTDRSSPRTSVGMLLSQQHLRDRLGHCMQWAHSLRTLNRVPSALAHRLPRVVGSAVMPEEVLTVDSEQASVGPDGQDSNSGVYIAKGQHPLSSHITTSHSHSVRPQSCSQCALATGYTTWRVETLSTVVFPDRDPLSMDTLAHSWPRSRLKYTLHPVSLIAQILCKVREEEEQVQMVAPHWPN